MVPEGGLASSGSSRSRQDKTATNAIYEVQTVLPSLPEGVPEVCTHAGSVRYMVVMGTAVEREALWGLADRAKRISMPRARSTKRNSPPSNY